MDLKEMYKERKITDKVFSYCEDGRKVKGTF